MYTGRRGSEDSRDIDDGQMDLLEAFISTKQLDNGVVSHIRPADFNLQDILAEG